MKTYAAHDEPRTQTPSMARPDARVCRMLQAPGGFRLDRSIDDDDGDEDQAADEPDEGGEAE